MKRSVAVLFSVAALTTAVALAQETSSDPASAQADAGLDRTVLPIAEPTYPPITELDARNAKAPPRFEVKAPEGAPNVVIVLIDDMGFGQPSTFGGGIEMPTLDRLAAGGLRYNHFHTTALC
jgi:arylsulfatase